MIVETAIPRERAAWRRALAELSEVQQRALALRFGCGLGTAEVARILGTSEAAVVQLLTAAVARLTVGREL